MPVRTDPRVSVLIACRNGAAMLSRCLDSLARQTHSTIETWASRIVRATWQDVQRQFDGLAPVQRLAQLRSLLGCPLTARVEYARDLALLLQPGLPLVAPVLIEALLHVPRGLDACIDSGHLRALLPSAAGASGSG